MDPHSCVGLLQNGAAAHGATAKWGCCTWGCCTWGCYAFNCLQGTSIVQSHRFELHHFPTQSPHFLQVGGMQSGRGGGPIILKSPAASRLSSARLIANPSISCSVVAQHNVPTHL